MAKQKLKTKRAAAKRYRVTGSGHVKVGKKGSRHILTGKTRKRKRKLKKSPLVHSTDEKSIRRLLPYL